MKRVLKVIGKIVLVLLLLGLVMFVWRQYNYEWKFSSQLDDFSGEGMPYVYKDGKLSLDITNPLKLVPNNEAEVDTIQRRGVKSLNGIWQVEEGSWDQIPETFGHQVQVPGLLDLATPKFEFQTIDQSALEINPLVELTTPTRSQIPIIVDPNREAFWYKKTFQYDASVKELTLLKINKAKYHTTVWLNGDLIGENPYNFTPGVFDISSQVISGKNELLIRVGASMSGHEGKGQVLDGYDMEKTRFIPGIYDDVALISSGNLTVDNVQIAPDLEKEQLNVAVFLENYATDGKNEELEIEISDYYQPDSIILKTKTESFRVIANGNRQVYFEIPFKNAALWSPNNPNLYRMKVKSSQDEFVTRFGMREFYFDETTKLPTLNGKTTFLRGSNICYYRFSEDPNRGTKAWDEAWVRRVFEKCKEMNWNVLRTSLGSPPEFWYRIADEMGIMLVDEAPIWTFFRELNVDAETLVYEYTAQMESHWNYPSVIMWDAQNESLMNPTTLMALRTVRGIDLSDRAWDNGWDYPDRPTDPYEEHVYPHQPNLLKGEPTLYDLQDLDSLNYTSFFHSKVGANPLIVNEYGWLWLQRNGNPTELTKVGYNQMFEGATPDARFEFWNYRLAAMTETMRARRIAGVMNFTVLSHSYEGCYTSDNFVDLESLEFEPHFEKYMKSAFAPLGLCIWNWEVNPEVGAPSTVELKVYNDDQVSYSGEVQLELKKEDRVLSNAFIEIEELKSGDDTAISMEVTYPKEAGDYTLEASLVDIHGVTIKSIRKIRLE